MTVFTRLDRLWQNGKTISYAWSSEFGGTGAQHKKVRTCVREWERYANVRFVEVESASDLVIGFDPTHPDGSWSFTGLEALEVARDGRSTINLAWVDTTEEQPTKAERAVILQKFGQALGMVPEHKNPSGGGIPADKVRAVQEFYGRTQGWDAIKTKEEVIDRATLQDVSAFSERDYLSISQYPMPKEFTGLPEDIGFNYELTDLDKAYMNVMYPRRQAHPEALEWSLKHALWKTGIKKSDHALYKTIQGYAVSDVTDHGSSIDATRIRQAFSAWCREAHMPKV